MILLLFIAIYYQRNISCTICSDVLVKKIIGPNGVARKTCCSPKSSREDREKKWKEERAITTLPNNTRGRPTSTRAREKKIKGGGVSLVNTHLSASVSVSWRMRASELWTGPSYWWSPRDLPARLMRYGRRSQQAMHWQWRRTKLSVVLPASHSPILQHLYYTHNIAKIQYRVSAKYQILRFVTSLCDFTKWQSRQFLKITFYSLSLSS